MDLSIVLPCYNEALSLPSIIDQFRAISAPYTWELILVDNGSTDQTWEVLQAQSTLPNTEFLRTLRLLPNQGYGGGILAGLAQAEGAVLAWSHADMQTPPKDIFAGYQALLQSPTPARAFVKGRRQRRPIKAEALTIGMQLAASLCLGMPLKDINAQPKVFSRSLFDAFRSPPTDFNLDLYLCHLAQKQGFHLATIPVEFGKRAHGQSRWAFSIKSKAIHISKTMRYIAKLSRESRR